MSSILKGTTAISSWHVVFSGLVLTSLSADSACILLGQEWGFEDVGQGMVADVGYVQGRIN